MKNSVRIGGLACAAAAVAFTFMLATPVSAALPQHLTCAKLSSPKSSGTSHGTISSCTPAALAAGATSAFTTPPKGTQAGTLKGTYTWKNGKGKTIMLITFKLQATRRKRPTGTSRVAVTGKVTGGSGAAAKIIKVNEPVSASVCAVTSGANAGKTTLEPGTKFKA